MFQPLLLFCPGRLRSWITCVVVVELIGRLLEATVSRCIKNASRSVHKILEYLKRSRAITGTSVAHRAEKQVV